jgi:ketosteroid isomerase-like protein
MRNSLLFSVALILFILNSCNTGQKPLSKSELHKLVKEQNEKLGECFTTSNIEKLAEMYTDSAKLSPNGNDFVFGRNNIKEFWAQDFEISQVVSMKTEILTVDGNENLIYETGKTINKILYNDSVYTIAIKYINVWKKQEDGTYKLDVDFWNKDIRN